MPSGPQYRGLIGRSPSPRPRRSALRPDAVRCCSPRMRGISRGSPRPVLRSSARTDSSRSRQTSARRPGTGLSLLPCVVRASRDRDPCRGLRAGRRSWAGRVVGRRRRLVRRAARAIPACARGVAAQGASAEVCRSAGRVRAFRRDGRASNGLGRSAHRGSHGDSCGGSGGTHRGGVRHGSCARSGGASRETPASSVRGRSRGPQDRTGAGPGAARWVSGEPGLPDLPGTFQVFNLRRLVAPYG